MGRPSKSAAETAEKLSIICGTPLLATCTCRVMLPCTVDCLPTPPPEPSQEAPAPAIVLDTNVVFDWLLFCNPDCETLGVWLRAGRARWLASPAMRAEMAHVLGRGRLDKWRVREPALWCTWDQLSMHAHEPAQPRPAARLRCTDTDDQKFIDLALASGARWLLSRDRAVLKLARRALAQGLTIQTPVAWAAEVNARG